ncbi:alpha/beta fold hydrolase [Pseudalkalibacillus decolorationis]|uniref:alpha/beta fold hydrolase n=1 Tax=Pseudalkalibacillus decolorationis TaxID=163879 RepID=UPI002147B844|nr:alpha/beta hydrolase [Pseudalkalibacillus decolorationis]
MTNNNERVVQANGVDLCVETFGNPADPAIILISGAPLACSMHWWEDVFCERLAAGSRFLIRYDTRDFGRSATYKPGDPQYSLRDLAADVVGLLDTFGLPNAHLVGFGVGGWIGQLAALDYPDRVTSLTLISTRPNAQGPTDPDLPEHSEEFMAYIKEAPEPDWSNRAEVIEYIVGFQHALANSHFFDKATKHDLAGRIFDRTANIASSMKNPPLVDKGDRWRERLGEMRAPTLVIHGTEDPFFPYGNALALEKEIPDAQLIALEQTGHELPRAVWDVVVSAILRHTEAS